MVHAHSSGQQLTRPHIMSSGVGMCKETCILTNLCGASVLAGYVEQFDTLVDTLTCQEMLLYTAQLKRPRTEPLAAKQAAVQALLSKLCLSSCAHTQIGSCLKRGISGGQAKRLNIGIALITDPRVLFLDGKIWFDSSGVGFRKQLWTPAKQPRQMCTNRDNP